MTAWFLFIYLCTLTPFGEPVCHWTLVTMPYYTRGACESEGVERFGNREFTCQELPLERTRLHVLASPP